VIKEHAGQDFFFSGNNIPNSLKAEITIIARNAIKKKNVNGFPVHVLQEKKKLIRYQIIATEITIFTRYANTPQNGNEPGSDIKNPDINVIRYDSIVLISIFAVFNGIKNCLYKRYHFLVARLVLSRQSPFPADFCH
jgi:hypothetical protein